MNAFCFVQGRQLRRAAGAFILLLLVGSCSDPPKNRFQGYVEGEFVYVASPLAGQLETLSVQRDQQVTTGQPLSLWMKPLQVYLCLQYGSDFNYLGRTYQVRVQADGKNQHLNPMDWPTESANG